MAKRVTSGGAADLSGALTGRPGGHRARERPAAGGARACGERSTGAGASRARRSPEAVDLDPSRETRSNTHADGTDSAAPGAAVADRAATCPTSTATAGATVAVTSVALELAHGRSV
jgi:hypothetical protein